MKARQPAPPEERILKCAIKEFSRHGYAGARMDRIAIQAKISKRMLFYYYGSKKRLFERVIESDWQTDKIMQEAPTTVLESLAFWSAFYLNNRDSTKLVGWEGLEWRNEALPREKERRALWKRSIKIMKDSAGLDGWPEDLDSAFLLFGLISMEMAPVLLPNLAALILEQDTTRPEFQQKWMKFMQSFGEAMMRSSLSHKANA